MFTCLRRILFCLLWLWLPVSQAADTGWLRAADNTHASVRLRAQQENGDVSFPMETDEPLPKTLSGVLTLSTCSNVCILTDYPFSLDMTAPAGEDFNYDFTRAMGTLPLTSGLARQLTARYASGKLTLQAERDGGWQRPAIYIDDMEGVDFGKPLLRTEGNTLRATVPVSDGWGETAPDISHKMLSLVLADGGQAQESRVAIDKGSAAPPLSLGWVLLMALAGGLILNVMPCVLPVLAMKLGALVQTQTRERGAVRRQFLASICGIVASFLALALMMTLLRLGNQALGWGIQFQNPWFIGAMGLVMALFSASLLGLFEFRLSSGASTFLATRGGSGIMGHFWQGAFATLLATPCTAPFLGTAVSAALVAPLPLLWGIFFAMGVGMSLPWLAVALWPGLAKRLPRPGRWMNGVRLVLGLMMLGSAVWLISLLTAHIGRTAVGLLMAALALALLLAIVWRYRGTAALWTGAVTLVTVCAVALLTLANVPGPRQDRIDWQPLSEQAIVRALADHKRVFVDVTADWCVTCKANKYNVLLRDDVQSALSAPDVVALRGDWTRPSVAINSFLTARGSAAVPFNQIYGPGLPEGRVQPPLLDRDALLAALSDAKGK